MAAWQARGAAVSGRFLGTHADFVATLYVQPQTGAADRGTTACYAPRYGPNCAYGCRALDRHAIETVSDDRVAVPARLAACLPVLRSHQIRLVDIDLHDDGAG